MIYYIKGTVTIKEKDFVIIESNGVGYKVFVAPETRDLLEKEVTIYCFTKKTDKENQLYGFPEKENLELFEKLLKISGIGPKTALGVSSIASMEELKKGIEVEDKKIIKKIFKVGKKKGEQIVFEISRKMIQENKKDEVYQALKNLGFQEYEINEALKNTSSENSDEERMAEALKYLGK
ncbi:MAG: Holliday junction branch migration protein RuvA [Patescibacteria group bacterium]|nr:Holliday junction branch migration protein RuvA [Patescibacteria group bacterium]